MAGKVIGIGIGPGDPELITIKAVKTLKTADVICVPKAHVEKPSMALAMVKHILEKRERPPEVLELVFPMTKDESELKRSWARNADIIAEKAKNGNTIAFITLGDPMFYSTFIYLYQSMKERYPEVKLEIIPGITSLTACAASSKIPLAERDEAVVIIPSDFDSKQIEEMAKYIDNFVFMKGAQRLKDLVPILERAGFTKKSTIVLAKRCTMPKEKLMIGKLIDVQSWDIYEDYFSMVIIKRIELQSNRK
ncbi:MAG: precorrin-2 C(20)-methyltransferase [archaeon]|nr:precorrin-2 C(20)-methyltransferase [archaeon]MCP8313381.1 precorrin-2 C(20)-methyltransferase [archaeon]